MKNKKGIIFTILSIFLSILFFLIITGENTNSLINTNLELESLRADMLNSYYDSFVDYSNYVFKISASSCIKHITLYMISEKEYYNNKNDFFYDIKYCMNYSNITKLKTYHIPESENRTISKLFNDFTNLTNSEYDLITNYSISNLEVSFDENYTDKLVVSADIKLEITDSKIFLSPPTYNSFVYVSLENAFDPAYSINLGEDRQINEIFIIGKNDDELYNLNFSDFIEMVDYLQYSQGTSIINRIINNTNISQPGVMIEDGFIAFINKSLSLGSGYSYVDLFYYSDIKFNNSDLYCWKNNTNFCADNFSVDKVTFFSMKLRYNLNTDDWGIIN